MTAWRRSTRCEAGMCIELAAANEQVHVRDSTQPAVVLTFDRPEWKTILVDLHSGRWGTWARALDTHTVRLTDPTSTHLNVTHADWQAFLAGAQAGDFDDI